MYKTDLFLIFFIFIFKPVLSWFLLMCNCVYILTWSNRDHPSLECSGICWAWYTFLHSDKAMNTPLRTHHTQSHLRSCTKIFCNETPIHLHLTLIHMIYQKFDMIHMIFVENCDPEVYQLFTVYFIKGAVCNFKLLTGYKANHSFSKKHWKTFPFPNNHQSRTLVCQFN